MKNTKTKLISSVAVLLICFAMLIGSTFAWFTDSASTGVNKIQAGNLDVQLLMYDAVEGDYVDIGNDNRAIFGSGSIAQNNNSETLWEPGKTQVAYLAIKNSGNLALKYKVVLDVTNEANNLYEVMKYSITPDANNNNPVTNWTSGDTVVTGQQVVATDVSIPAGATHYFALSVHMDETAGNSYKNGKVNFDLTVYAAQLSSEEDSFDNTYDMFAQYDDVSPVVPPTIEVGGAAQLRTALEQLNTSGTINLTQDIDLSGVSWDSPIMSYTSQGEQIVINGNGHTIKNITSTSGQYGGLIGKLTTNGQVIIQDLNLENVTLSGTNIDGECAGGALIGWYEGHGDSVTITNVKVNGVAIDGFKYTGGFIGYTNGDVPFNISGCEVTGNSTLNTLNSSYNESGNYKGHIGGLIGYYPNGTLSNCKLSNINITRSGDAQNNRTGALIGTLYSSATVDNVTLSNVKLLGVAVTSSSNMVGPDASTGTSTNIKVN